jgi:hypothetical protein
MKKYDSALSDKSQKRDWPALLTFERVTLARHSLRSIFFPWKT